MYKLLISFIITTIFLLPLNLTNVIADETNNYREYSMTEKKRLITETAIKYNIPPEILKAIALMETKMKQFENGKPIISDDGGIGIMQITNTDIVVDKERLKYDTAYNIDIAGKVLKQKWELQFKGILPKINDSNPKIIEHWYFAIMAYNGVSKINDPNNLDEAYQDRILNYIENFSRVDLAEVPEIEVSYNEDGNFSFEQTQLHWPEANSMSTQMFKAGDEVYVMNSDNPFYFNYGNLREEATLSSTITKKVPYYTNFEIVSGPYYETDNDANHFVIYEVRGNGMTGFLSSSNIRTSETKFNEYEQWNSGQTVSVSDDKIWSIYFNVPLDGQTVNPKNIYVEDQLGNGLFTSVTYDINEGVIQIKPEENYKVGQTYSLKIKGVTSANNIEMTKPISMKFMITKRGR